MVLQLDKLVKSYGKVQALKGVSFDVPEGSVYGILGPNGSGKTTLLSIVLDVLSADSGSYRWFGEQGSPEIRKHIGALLETPNFYHYLSALGNLRITKSISGRGNEAQIHEVLEQVRLSERKKSRFSTYSLGMKQRLAIAAALLGKPKVLVLDEPTNGLDPVGIAEVRELIRELRKQGFTIIIASHLLDEVERICTHVAILSKGQVLVQGTVDEVLADEDIVELSSDDLPALMQTLEQYPGKKELKLDHDRVLAYFPKGMGNASALNAYCHQQGIRLNHLFARKQKLEQKFFELTGN